LERLLHQLHPQTRPRTCQADLAPHAWDTPGSVSSRPGSQ
jgi:hypothetical protein